MKSGGMIGEIVRIKTMKKKARKFVFKISLTAKMVVLKTRCGI